MRSPAARSNRRVVAEQPRRTARDNVLLRRQRMLRRTRPRGLFHRGSDEACWAVEVHYLVVCITYSSWVVFALGRAFLFRAILVVVLVTQSLAGAYPLPAHY